VGCAVLLAARDLHGGPNDPAELALLAQQAENEIVGVPSGVMDQMASFSCRSGHALLLDCRSLSIEHVPLRLVVANLTLLVIDTRTPRSLVSEAYEARRRACEAAARALGVPALRDADEAGLARLGGTLGRRARHVVGEIARVLELAELLRSGRVEEAGSLLSASHASLRDDFEVSTTALDLAVDAAIAGGALGARMTGAGFGGCVVALARADTGQAVRDAVRAAFARNRLASPVFISARGAGGARRA
jgi:galactokinase